jgi:hypothetical protein
MSYNSFVCGIRPCWLGVRELSPHRTQGFVRPKHGIQSDDAPSDRGQLMLKFVSPCGGVSDFRISKTHFASEILTQFGGQNIVSQ